MYGGRSGHLESWNGLSARPYGTRHGLIACPVNPSNEKEMLSFFLFFVRSCLSFGVYRCFSVFFLCVFSMSLQPICIVVTHHMWHFPPYLASSLHVCLVDISNLDKFIRSLPRGEHLTTGGRPGPVLVCDPPQPPPPGF